MDFTRGMLLEKVLMDGIKEILLIIRVSDEGELYYEYINRVAINRTSLTAEAVGRKLGEVHTSEDFEFFKSNHMKVIYTKQEYSYEDSFISPCGGRYYSQSRLTPLFDENGIVQYIVVLVHDITSEKEAELALKSSNEMLLESRDQFRIIAENSHDLILLISVDGFINFISPSCEELLGIPSNEFEGQHYTVFVHPEEQQLLKDAFRHAVTYKQPLKGKYRMQNSIGMWIWFELHGSPVFNDQGVYSHFVAVSRDITTSHEYENKLKYFAYNDVLADLPNRRLFLNNLTTALSRNDSSEKQVVLLLLDIDDFKLINDRNGHHVGDLVIKEFANRLKQVVNCEEKTVSRLGGDEFAIILPSIGKVEEAELIAKDILRIMRESWMFENRTFHVTTSIGLAVASKKHETNDSLMKKADMALYEAKESGRNSFRLYK
ncbi:diguanylate cyclase [Sporosarcina sp. Sa2YVA2]|uniref:Diguanylate cyclase n=1 Tax=Sporosarcina quadrami TaxID=2762234 RepID=A0ABR8UBE6_9BACL|nr:sensor domain-containing diguanylate cyclase [Sporosarcina quadrami]MBD7985345.1 diguanylate cyclase [Sporosarcina quadrami]